MSLRTTWQGHLSVSFEYVALQVLHVHWVAVVFVVLSVSSAVLSRQGVVIVLKLSCCRFDFPLECPFFPFPIPILLQFWHCSYTLELEALHVLHVHVELDMLDWLIFVLLICYSSPWWSSSRCRLSLKPNRTLRRRWLKPSPQAGLFLHGGSKLGEGGNGVVCIPCKIKENKKGVVCTNEKVRRT